MTTIQVRNDNDNEPLVLSDDAEVRTGFTLAASQGNLVPGTVLAEVTGTPGTYVVYEDVAAADGTKIPKLILADTIADDASPTTGVSAYEKGLFAEEKLVFGGGVVLADRVTVATGVDHSVRDLLRQMGLRTANALSLTEFENV